MAFNDQVMDWLRRTESVKLVVLSSPFSQLLDGSIMTEKGELITSPRIDQIAQEILATADEIRKTGARVVIVSPTPQSGWDTGQCLVRSVFFNADETSCNFTVGEETEAELLLKAVQKNVPVYWLHDDLCANGICDPLQEGVFLFRDKGHLSAEGSAYLGQKNNWMATFREIAY